MAMLDYLVLPTPFSDTEALIEALENVRLGTFQMYQQPTVLKDKFGKPQAYRANLINTAENMNAEADIGFLQNNSGTFSLLISQADKRAFFNGRLKRLSDQYRYLLRSKKLKQLPSEGSTSNLAPVNPFYVQSRREMHALQLKNFWSNHTYHGRIENISLSPAGVAQLGVISNTQIPSGAFINIDSIILYFSNNYRLMTEEQQARWKQLVDQYCINEICKSWEISRDPEIGKLLEEQAWVATGPALLKILTAFKANQAERLNDLAAKDARLLLLACEDIDPIIAQRAQTYVQNLVYPTFLKGIAALWSQEREPLLFSMLMAKNYAPKPVGKVGVLIALKNGKDDLFVNSSVTTVKHLVEACDDQDVTVKETALRALSQLKQVVAQQALCILIIESERDLPEVTNIALAQGYLPADPHQRILFCFVAEQWAQYDALDFDRSHLQKVYQTATPAFKRRVAEKIRKAGRPEYLEIITGTSNHRHQAESSLEEDQIAVEVLTANQDWASLWSLVPLVSLKWSGAIIAQLMKTDWQPKTEEERNLLAALKPLAGGNGFNEEVLQSYKTLPPALFRAEGHLTGRINSVAFSPTQTWLAFGTGTGKVVIWNSQTAQREAILTGAAHSIGHIAFTWDGTLICAEQTNRESDLCSIYYWEGKGTTLNLLGQHTGSITALCALNENEIVSAGRDGLVKLWNISAARVTRSLKLPDWPRMACLSEDGNQLALWLNRRIHLIRLPNLEDWVDFSTNTAKMARSMTFLPGNTTVMAGRFKEWISMYYVTNPKTQNWRPVPLKLKSDTMRNIMDVAGLSVLTKHELVVAAQNNGTLYFLELDNAFKVREQVKTGHTAVTGLTLSRDKAFMAVSNADASFTLWDLRGLDLDQLFEKPLGQAAPRHLTALNLLLEQAAVVSFELKRVLQYLKLVLLRRLQYTIELDEEVATIKSGIFDIEIEQDAEKAPVKAGLLDIEIAS